MGTILAFLLTPIFFQSITSCQVAGSALTALTYIVINTKALMRIRSINCSLIANIVRGASLVA